MILVGSQRGGAGQLAAHLMNDIDNEHVELSELRGFVSDDLAGALAEIDAVSGGTRCTQFMFSLSFNPPKNAEISTDEFRDAVDRAEERLGLTGQPRAIVFHEKEGRRHAHVVWSRIDAEQMKAVQMPYFKNRLMTLSKELYLEHGWELPNGHKENGWKNPLNFTLAEWQQAKRLDLHPQELKQLFQAAWKQSDNLASFRSALEDKGYFLARGDRRGFVAVDIHGEVHSVARLVGIKTKDLEQRLGSPEPLPGCEGVQTLIREKMSDRLAGLIKGTRQAQQQQLEPLLEERRQIVLEQRREREVMREGQEKRRQEENRERQTRFRGGIRGVWDILTGHARTVRSENERETFAAYQRDRQQRDAMVEAQLNDRAGLQDAIKAMRRTQRIELMETAERVAFLMWLERAEAAPVRQPPRGRSRELELD